MYIVKIVLTAILSVAALFGVTKLMGHKQVAQMDFFDYVCGITIGSIGAELATELESPEKPLIALAVYALASVALSLAVHKMPRMRKYVNGSPTILICGGKIYRRNMKKAKLDLSELMLLCRERGYFRLDDIEVAVFEPNGKLSVLPKSEKRSPTVEELNVKAPPAEIGAELIMDGRIMGENLSRIGRDAGWLSKRIKALGYDSASRIFLAVYYKGSDELNVYPNV